MSADVLALSAAQAEAAVARGDLGRDELWRAWRDAAAGDELNALTWTSEADTAPGDGSGAPLAVKDLFCTEGIPSQAGSKILEGYRPPYTATVVERSGSPVLAKANQDEFAMGSSNENSAYGAVKNPRDPSRVPGGSSGGSAAAVAGGLAPWALGTDTGGSIRQPAALCGVVGLKPTYGLCSRYGAIAFASSLDCPGPITRDVTDAALLLSRIAGRDPRDATSLDPREVIVAPSGERLDGLVLGVPGELTGEGVDPGVLAAFHAALRTAEDLGARIEELTLPHTAHALAAYYVLAPAEASSNLSRYDGVRYGLRTDEPSLEGMMTATRHDGFGDEVKRRILIGTYALSSGYYDAYYGRAQQVRTKVAQDFTEAFAKVDLVVSPTSPTVAWGLGEKADDPLAMYLSDVGTIPASLAGLPGLSLPCGESDGLPVGVQLVAPAFGEQALLEAGFALEGALG